MIAVSSTTPLRDRTAAPSQGATRDLFRRGPQIIHGIFVAVGKRGKGYVGKQNGIGIDIHQL